MNKHNNRLLGQTGVHLRFTLIELLVVMAIITLLAGIGVGVFGKLSGQMNQTFMVSDLKQLLITTIQESRRSQVPMFVRFNSGGFKNGEPDQDFTVEGSQNTLVAYWSFGDSSFAGNVINEVGVNPHAMSINRVYFATNFDENKLKPGFLGKGYLFDGSGTVKTSPHSILNGDSNFYVEVRAKIDTQHTFNSGGSSTILSIGDQTALRLDAASGEALLATPDTDSASAEDKFSMLYPEDGMWHRIGMSKIQGIGIFIYLDDQLVFYKSVVTAPGTDAHQITLGQNFKGMLDELRFYRLGGGQTLSLLEGGIHFKFGQEPLLQTIFPAQYIMLIQPQGLVPGILKQGDDFNNIHFSPKHYLHIFTGEHCLIEGAGGSSVENLDRPVKFKDPGFPDQGYAYIRAYDNASEIVKYEIYNGSGRRKLRVMAANQLGTDGSGSLGNYELTLLAVQPIIITRSGAVL